MIESIKATVVDVFTTTAGQGNPAGVITEATGLSVEEMQAIAAELGFNETAFVLPSSVADLRLRYFSPGHEMPLCGHATIGSIKALMREQELPAKLTIETMNAVLDVTIADNETITMRQESPRFANFHGDPNTLARILGIEATDFDGRLSIVYGSTGTWTLLVPVRDETILAKMKPQSVKFPEILQEKPRCSIHPFCLESQEDQLFSARHFSSPYSGTIEDPVTGTATGVMAAYAHEHLYPHEKKVKITVTQGRYVERPGIISATSQRKDNRQIIHITGEAVVHPDPVVIQL